MTEIKKCWTCRRYKAYYGKYSDGFCKMLRGRCRYKQQDVDNKDSCEAWVNNSSKRKSDAKITLKKLEQAIESINQIKLVLLDNAEEDKLNSIK